MNLTSNENLIDVKNIILKTNRFLTSPFFLTERKTLKEGIKNKLYFLFVKLIFIIYLN